MSMSTSEQKVEDPVFKEEVLGQFLGDEKFPVTWSSELEKHLFWVYDDLHNPQPLSPMHEDIGLWTQSCDHMFRRFGTPFATDWIPKNVNGYLYTAQIPGNHDFRLDNVEVGTRYGAAAATDPECYASKIGTYLGAVLPTYGQQFADWWRDRLVPEMKHNFDYLEGMLDKQDELTLMELACLLEDAIDMHDRHWKIHWMLNFAQLSATLNPRPVALKSETAGEIIAALKGTERGRKFIEERVVPYQKEFGWHAVWSHEFVFPTVYEHMEPVIELVRGYIETNYDYPKTIKVLSDDIAAAAKEILEGLKGEGLEEMRVANDINLKMAPLTPDHHFYIDQGANAHVRLVLIAIGKKLVAQGVLDAPDDVIFLHYNELREFMGDPTAMDARALVAKARAAREKAYSFRPRDWIGTVTQSQLDFPYLNLWGFPDKFNRKAGTIAGQFTGLGGSPGVVEGVARVVLREDQFDEVRGG